MVTLQAACRGKLIDDIASIQRYTVTTTYQRRMSYRIVDVEFNMNPTLTFRPKNREVTFIEYLRSRYGVTVADVNQPMLRCNCTQKESLFEDYGTKFKSVYLVPEVCETVSYVIREPQEQGKQFGRDLHASWTYASFFVAGFLMCMFLNLWMMFKHLLAFNYCTATGSMYRSKKIYKISRD